MTNEEIFALLKVLGARLHTVQGPMQLNEPYHVTEFQAETPTMETVRIRILDGGPEFTAPEYRYNCEVWVVDDEGKRVSEVVTGNGAATPKEALECAQWLDLIDREGR